jgi:hypothetical protein
VEVWRAALRGDPLPWLLDEEAPAVRHLALRWLLDEPADDPRVRRARAAAMRAHPIAPILEAQHPDGWWVKPGHGYAPKYTGTVWSFMFLDQMGADGGDPRVQRACDYVLEHVQAPNGAFGCSGRLDEHRPPPDSTALHCLNGNLLRALIGFGHLDDPRVRQAVDWQARSITGEGFDGYYRSGTSGPGFACAANERLPCGWGAIKAVGALARVPPRRRAAHVRRAVAAGAEFLLSRDPAVADYPMGWGNTRPSASWFKVGFPSGYVADVLQNLEVLCELGYARDPRLANALDLVVSKQRADGTWRNEYAYNRKTWGDIERQGQPSRWVTLRACAVLRQALG